MTEQNPTYHKSNSGCKPGLGLLKNVQTCLSINRFERQLFSGRDNPIQLYDHTFIHSNDHMDKYICNGK